MSAPDNRDDVFAVNPYQSHPSLSPTESEVLWEYAKLSAHVKALVVKTRQLSQEPDEKLLSELRVLERKMGLVLTLFKASVWGVINEQPADNVSLSFDTTEDMTAR